MSRRREIFPNLTVKENLRLGSLAAKSGRGGAERAAPLDDVFELFPKLAQLLGRKGGVLSGGEQQQLAIARVLLARPKILLMDEPTEGIQPSIINQIEDAIERIKAAASRPPRGQYLEFAWRESGSPSCAGSIVSGATGNLRLTVEST
jgi:urea transport system ATP-binding protein